jgi:hypothetical protein
MRLNLSKSLYILNLSNPPLSATGTLAAGRAQILSSRLSSHFFELLTSKLDERTVFIVTRS